ncbi:MAG: trypsin-like serine protease [Pseudomonadota bacterium]
MALHNAYRKETTGRLVVSIIATALAVWVSPGFGDDAIGSSQQELRGARIINGFRGVVDLSFSTQVIFPSSGGCTGIIVGQGIVLTAGHCVLRNDTMPRAGSGNAVIHYYDPATGRTQVHNGPVDYAVHQEYRRDDRPSERRKHDLAVIKMVGANVFFAVNDMLMLYNDSPDRLVDRWLDVFGAGVFDYAGNQDNNLRTERFEVVEANESVIRIDNRTNTTTCIGDSGGPIMELVPQNLVLLPAVAGLLSQSEVDRDNEGPNCANNDNGSDDSFFTSVSFSNVSALMTEMDVNCTAIQVDAWLSWPPTQLRRCYPVQAFEPVPVPGGIRNEPMRN